MLLRENHVAPANPRLPPTPQTGSNAAQRTGIRPRLRTWRTSRWRLRSLWLETAVTVSLLAVLASPYACGAYVAPVPPRETQRHAFYNSPIYNSCLMPAGPPRQQTLEPLAQSGESPA